MPTLSHQGHATFAVILLLAVKGRLLACVTVNDSLKFRRCLVFNLLDFADGVAADTGEIGNGLMSADAWRLFVRYLAN